MRKVIFIGVSLLLLLSSCVQGEAHGEGYILEINGQRVLILDKLEEEDIGKKWNDIMDEYRGNAIVLSTDQTDLEVGHYVEYWIDGEIATSYPEQAKAKKIKVIEESTTN